MQRQRSLFIVSILSQAEDETENEIKSEMLSETLSEMLNKTLSESQNDHQIENDEIENENKQQCSKRLNKYTKTDDAKNKNAFNRLRFMNLKS
jgi:hypothetical protein